MKEFIGKHKGLLIVSVAIIIVFALLGWNFQRSRAYRQTSTTESKSAITTVPKKQSAAKGNEKADGGKILIVFFSRSGINYGNKNLEIGNTHRVANEIARVTKGDEVELKTVQPYPANYDQTVDQAQNEQNTNARPKLQEPLPDISQYQTVFIGYPIWWSDIPMPVRTFMDSADLNGKTVIPFSTNEGSGWGNSLETLKHQYPHANFKKGFETEGNKAQNANKEIDSWLESLGYHA